jgi:hypothetical protein
LLCITASDSHGLIQRRKRDKEIGINHSIFHLLATLTTMNKINATMMKVISAARNVPVGKFLPVYFKECSAR